MTPSERAERWLQTHFERGPRTADALTAEFEAVREEVSAEAIRQRNEYRLMWEMLKDEWAKAMLATREETAREIAAWLRADDPEVICNAVRPTPPLMTNRKAVADAVERGDWKRPTAPAAASPAPSEFAKTQDDRK